MCCILQMLATQRFGVDHQTVAFKQQFRQTTKQHQVSGRENLDIDLHNETEPCASYCLRLQMYTMAKEESNT